MNRIPDRIEFETPRLILRSPLPEDIQAMQAIFNDPRNLEFTPHLARAEGWSLEDVEQRYDKKRAAQKQQTVIELTVVERETGAMIGEASVFHIETAHRRGEAGLMLHHPYWGKGYGVEALRALLGYAFGEIGFHRVEFVTLTENARTRRLMEKLGVPLEGVKKECIYEGGRYLDQATYAVFDRDWAKISSQEA